ncbi:MAG TPA: hypothetical protein VFA43_04630 [Gemmatimonadaceae bacterium]|nr:hypothetical protein [Gemmatimonadaceae bacterium]
MSAHGAPAPDRAELIAMATRPAPRTAWTAALWATAIGVVAFLIALFVNADRAWRAFEYNWYFFASISSAGVAWAAVQRITTARWSRPVVRFMEGYVAFLPIGFLFLLLILFVGGRHIFTWLVTPPWNPERRLYLSPTFWYLRDIITYLVISGLSISLVYLSLRLDVGGMAESGAAWAAGIRARMRAGFGEERREMHTTHSRQGWIAVLTVFAFAYGWYIYSNDMALMLDPHFTSTLYGWWSFITAWLGAIMSVSLLTMWWRNRLGAQHLIVTKHFHDLGKLCFAFTCFWGYLTFGQYLVIWYGNMPEDTHFMFTRFVHPWFWTSTIAVALAFLPFFGLMSKAAKVYLPTFVLFACSSLLGTYLQRYGEVYPSIYLLPKSLPFGWMEIGVTLLYLGLWGLCYLAFMDAFPKMRIVMQASPYRDEVQVPVDPRTMEPLPAHE